MGKCYHNYLFTILLGVAMALSGCAPSKTETEKSIQGRWQRIGAPNVHDPFQTLATEYIELRSNGVLVSLLADTAPQTFWTIATGAYSVPQVGQIIVHGKCWQGWQNYNCSRTYRFELNQDHLVIFDDAYEGRSVEYSRFGPAGVELRPTLAPPIPSATPMGQLRKP